MEKKRGPYRTGRARVELILDAAHHLFITEGYGATSLRSIAAASGISHPALLRHFPTKGDILTSLVRRLEADQNGGLTPTQRILVDPPSPGEIARRNQDTPGWIELFTALLGEATSPEHPGHQLMLERRKAGLALGRRLLASLSPDERSAEREMVRIMAMWDGLQILDLYFPGEIDLPASLEDYFDDLERNGVPHPEPVADWDAPPPAAGESARSSDRRRRVVECAAQRYASHGYYGTSMQSVADDAGITKAALVHIAPTKEELLRLVLDETFERGDIDAASWVSSIATRPRWLLAAQVVLMCEATVPLHPAHSFMAETLGAGRMRAAEYVWMEGMPSDLAGAAGDRLVGLVLGVVIGWLYDPTRAEPRAILGGELQRVATARWSEVRREAAAGS